MTPVPSHYELQPGWKRCSYLMEPIDFQLRNFMIHFILSPQQHATVHYNSGLYLIDKAAIAGLTYECDSYRQVNRAVGDQTMTPTFVTHCPGGTWENVPLSKIRTRPVKILFDWVFNETEAYWCPPCILHIPLLCESYSLLLCHTGTYLYPRPPPPGKGGEVVGTRRPCL